MLTFISFITFILSTIGATLIITTSSLFKPVRELGKRIHPKLGKFLSCSMCIGAWSGVTVYLLEYFGFSIINYAFMGSFVSYVAYLLLKPLIEKYD